MADSLAIAAAIATKARGIAGIKQSDHLVPDGLTKTPAFVVFPPDGTLTEYPSQDLVESTYLGFLYLTRPADTGRTLAKVYPFIDLFYAAWRVGRTLGGLVQETWLRGHRLDDLPDYGGAYLGLEWRIGVRSRDNITRSA